MQARYVPPPALNGNRPSLLQNELDEDGVQCVPFRGSSPVPLYSGGRSIIVNRYIPIERDQVFVLPVDSTVHLHMGWGTVKGGGAIE